MRYHCPHVSFRSIGFKRLLREMQFCKDAGYPVRKAKYYQLLDINCFWDTPLQSLDYSWKRQTKCRKQWQKKLKY